MTNQLCRGILRSLAAVHNHASARCSPALQQLRSTSPKCWHLGPKVDARLNHTSLPDSFKTIFGNEQKNVLQARGTVLRPKEDSPLEIDINELPVEKLRKLDVCRRYNLQPRDVRRARSKAKRKSLSCHLIPAHIFSTHSARSARYRLCKRCSD